MPNGCDRSYRWPWFSAIWDVGYLGRRSSRTAPRATWRHHWISVVKTRRDFANYCYTRNSTDLILLIILFFMLKLIYLSPPPSPLWLKSCGRPCWCLSLSLYVFNYPSVHAIISLFLFLYLNSLLMMGVFTLIFDGGGLILSTLFPFVKTIEKVNFWYLFCIVKYG